MVCPKLPYLTTQPLTIFYCYIDMKGRTLSPLKTEELSLTLRPLKNGTFRLKPRVLYLDESGRYKSHEPEPATVEVLRRRGPPI